jgi:hypothetical protein
MMAIDLSSYTSIETGLFVRIDVAEYRTTSSGTYANEILRFSDYTRSVVIDGETYLGLGRLIGVTATSSELKSSSGSVTITISGIPDSSIAEIVNSRIKGSAISIYRVVFDAVTGQQLSITGNPAGRFFGIVSNYTLEEDYDVEARTASNTIALECSSRSEFLANKVVGRKTNPKSMKTFYSTDVSMDRVPNLVGANFNFGAPQ